MELVVERGNPMHLFRPVINLPEHPSNIPEQSSFMHVSFAWVSALHIECIYMHILKSVKLKSVKPTMRGVM